MFIPERTPRVVMRRLCEYVEDIQSFLQSPIGWTSVMSNTLLRLNDYILPIVSEESVDERLLAPIRERPPRCDKHLPMTRSATD